MRYKLKKYIPAKGYPLTDPYYNECHHYANMMEIKKYGIHRFHQLNALFLRHPRQLLGTHTPTGIPYEASFVPKKFRKQILDHEEWEFECQKKKAQNIIS